MRKPKTNRVPCTRAGGEWTEAAFWGFLRSILRQGSQKWPPIVRQALLAVRRANLGPNRRLKWEHQCSECGEWRPRKEVQVDHIVPCGELRSFGDLERFVRNLFCEADELRVVCEDCHQEKTNFERTCRTIEKYSEEQQ